MLNRLLLFFSLLLVSNTYSFYNIYGDTPFKYRAVFTGDITVSSSVYGYTNNNIMFSLDYSVETKSEFFTKAQTIVDWKFSKISSQGLPSIVDNILNELISSQMQDIVYIVKTDNDSFWVFDKQGNKTILSHYLENLFPIVNMVGRPYKQTYNIPTKSKDTIGIMIQGGEYHYYDLSENPSSLIRHTNDVFINKFYNRHLQYYQSGDETLFWTQQMNIRHLSPYNRTKKELETLGMYFIDPRQRIIQQALLRVRLNSSILYQQPNFNQEFDILLDGHFDISLLSE